ncbi:MAG: hypothetical protein ACJ76F_11375, partial [Bacteroidia bacterium]
NKRIVFCNLLWRKPAILALSTRTKMDKNRIKISNITPTSIPEFKGNEIESIGIYGRTKEELRTGISRIRLAFFNVKEHEVLLDFKKATSTDHIILVPDESNFILGFNFCRIHNVYGELLPSEEIYLRFKKTQESA